MLIPLYNIIMMYEKRFHMLIKRYTKPLNMRSLNTGYQSTTVIHDDVIKRKHFPCYWPFVQDSPVTDEFPWQRPVTRKFDVFFDLRLYKRLSKQSWGWWFETP